MSYLINVIDIECTCWPNHNNEASELIEVGICVIDLKHLNIMSIDSIIVKPTTTKVSEYCTELTGHTQAIVDEGISFNECCTLLKKRYASKKRLFASWGNYDRNRFLDQCEKENISYPFGSSHFNVKTLFMLFHRDYCNINKGVDMTSALNELGLYHVGSLHSGVDDAYNIGVIFIELLKKLQNKN